MYDKQKFLLLLLVLTLIFSLFTIYVSSEEAPAVSARAAVLYEPETESFLYSKNSNEKLSMASTTKIMTALIALEELGLDEEIEVDSRAVGIEGSSIYLKEGERLTALDLVYALMLQSANDAAEALAYRISGSIEGFAALMNERAEALGLKDTNFENPHGLDAKNHYTTAHDLALISAKALENPIFKEIASCYKKEIESSEIKRTLVNHNKLLKSYEGCIGVKTGYTKKSGRSLVSAAERDGLRLISVTINAPNDWQDHKSLLDYGYSLLCARTLAYSGEYRYKIPVLSGECDYVYVSNKDSVKRIFKADSQDFDVQVKMFRYLAAPIAEGDIVGRVIFTQNGEFLDSVNLYAESNVGKIKKKTSIF